MSALHQMGNRIASYVRTHPREARFLGFFAALVLVWMLAPQIESLVQGFFQNL